MANVTNSRKKNSWALFVILAALGVQVVLLQWNSQPLKTWEHEAVAQNFLNGKGFTTEYLGTEYRALLHPFYPLLCAGIYRIFRNSHRAAALVQVIALGCVAWITYRIGLEVFNERAGNWAAVLVCLHPGLFIYTTRTLHPLIFDSFWFSLYLLWVLRLRRGVNLKRVALGGGILGVALLSRGTIFVFGGLSLLWLAKEWHLQLEKKLLFLAVWVLMTLAVLMPWVIRNVIVLGRAVPMTSTFGLQLWSGNNPNATGTLLTSSGEMVLGRDKEFLGRLYQEDELGQAKLFQGAAIEFIREHPLQALRLFFKKFYYFWWFSPQFGLWYPSSWRVLYALWYVGVAILAVIGVRGGWRRITPGEQRSRLLLLLLFLLSISLFQSIFFVEGRHRLAVEAVLLVLSAEGISILSEFPRRGRVNF